MVIGKHILSAFYLAVTLMRGIYFIMLRAQYLAAVQIGYIGSVIVLIIFALCYCTNVGDSTNISNNQKVFAALIAMYYSSDSSFYCPKSTLL
jgi:hypothetical protein